MFRKIEHIWVFAAIFSVAIIFMSLFYSQAVALEIELKHEPANIVIPEKKANKITLVFGGDVMLARTVEQKILKTGDWSLPFRKIYQEFAGADLAFANLESPFRDGGSATPNGSTVFRALPQTIEGLKLAGLDAVTLANNHFGDQGQAGKEYTFSHLKDNGLEYCGAGNNSDEAHAPVIKEVEGIKIGFLGYGYPESMYVATSSSSGIANMDISLMREDVRELKNKVDFMVVTMHAGAEYTHKPGQSQINFSRAAINSGADLVVGHHPHVVQTTEKYKNGYIIYSLGNLVFDQMWSEETQQGAVAKVILEGSDLKSIEFKPIHIHDYNQPDWADEIEAKVIFEDMGLEENFVYFE